MATWVQFGEMFQVGNWAAELSSYFASIGELTPVNHFESCEAEGVITRG